MNNFVIIFAVLSLGMAAAFAEVNISSVPATVTDKATSGSALQKILQGRLNLLYLNILDRIHRLPNSELVTGERMAILLDDIRTVGRKLNSLDALTEAGQSVLREVELKMLKLEERVYARN